MEEFYPMPMFVNLDVSDLSASIDWYRRVLGFRIVFTDASDRPTFAHLRRERYQDLLLTSREKKPEPRACQGILIQFQAGGTPIEELAEQARLDGKTQVEGPVERLWNVRDVTFSDPDGHRIRLSEPVNQDLGFKEVLASPDEK